MSHMTRAEIAYLLKQFDEKERLSPGFKEGVSTGVQIIAAELKRCEFQPTSPRLRGMGKLLKHYCEESRSKPHRAFREFNVAIDKHHVFCDVQQSIRRARIVVDAELNPVVAQRLAADLTKKQRRPVMLQPDIVGEYSSTV